MDKVELLAKISTKNYSHDQLVGWITAMAGSIGTKKPTIIKSGDVFMHPVFKHPYVFLHRIDDDTWACTLLTSDAEYEQVLEPCNSRFFTGSYFTKTIFTMSSKPVGSFCNVFDNPKQVKEVLNELRQIFR